MKWGVSAPFPRIASGSRFCSLYSASLFMYPNQQLSQLVNSLHPSSYTSFHGGHLKFFSRTFTMFFFYIFRGFAELHSFCQFLKNCHFSFLPPRRAGPVSAFPGHHQRRAAVPGGRPCGRFGLVVNMFFDFHEHFIVRIILGK